MTINQCSDQRDKHLKVSSCTLSTRYHHNLFADLFFSTFCTLKTLNSAFFILTCILFGEKRVRFVKRVRSVVSLTLLLDPHYNDFGVLQCKMVHYIRRRRSMTMTLSHTSVVNRLRYSPEPFRGVFTRLSRVLLRRGL